MTVRVISDAESLFITGRAYVTGAHAIVKSHVRENYDNDTRFVIPCMMLIGHAIEVYLKAWLSFRGYANDQLRRPPFGHNLRNLYDEARLKGLPESNLPPQHSFHDLVESYEVAHGEFQFRYPSDGWAFAVPKVEAVFQILVALDTVVASEIGTSIPGDLDWAVTGQEDFRLPPPPYVPPL